MLYVASPPPPPPHSDRFFAVAAAAAVTLAGLPAPPLYLGVDCEQWGKECGERERRERSRNMDCDMEDPLTSFFNAAPPPSVGPILRGQSSSSSSCKGVYKSCLNYKLATEKRAAAPIAVGVKSCVYSKQDGIGEYRGEFVCSRRRNHSICRYKTVPPASHPPTLRRFQAKGGLRFPGTRLERSFALIC